MVGQPLGPNRGDNELRDNPLRVSQDGHFDHVAPPAAECLPAKHACMKNMMPSMMRV